MADIVRVRVVEPLGTTPCERVYRCIGTKPSELERAGPLCDPPRPGTVSRAVISWLSSETTRLRSSRLNAMISSRRSDGRAAPTLLLVDDEIDIRTIAALSLSVVGGWNVTLAASGREALEQVTRHRPDVVLLDLMMPEMDGLATMRRLRALDGSPSMPVIFLTARTQRSEIERCLDQGAAGVIAKPFDPMTLPMDVDRIVRGAPGTVRVPSPA